MYTCMYLHCTVQHVNYCDLKKAMDVNEVPFHFYEYPSINVIVAFILELEPFIGVHFKKLV